MGSRTITPTKLFETPGISPPLISKQLFSPDSHFFVFLKSSAENPNSLDLWKYDIEHQQLNLWIKGSSFHSSSDARNESEKAESERKRFFSHGISDISFKPNSEDLLICAEGHGYLIASDSNVPKRITLEESSQQFIKFSPKGTYLTYVRKNNLFILDLKTKQEHQLTDANDNPDISYGTPDFIAAEEMHRHEGYWWSPDEEMILFTKTNNSKVEKVQIYHSRKSNAETPEHSYPFAGTENPLVELYLIDIETKTQRLIDYKTQPEDYLARINWGTSHVAIQIQDRTQKTLEVKLLNPTTSNLDTILTERSATWINLHNDLSWKNDKEIIWTSELSGRNQIYLLKNKKLVQLSREKGRVRTILLVTNDKIYYDGWRATPTENHLYCLHLSPENKPTRTEQLTDVPGWHEITMDDIGLCYSDKFSAVDKQLELHIKGSPKLENVILKETVGLDHPYYPYTDSHSYSFLGKIGPNEDNASVLHYRLTPPQEIHDKHPVIVMVYGGPGVQRVKNEWPSLQIQLFTSLGYGVFELDNRGSSNREKEFEDVLSGKLGEEEVKDQIRGCEELKGTSWVDMSRIGVFGHSYGGYMAIMCAAKASNLFKASVAVAPVTKWELYDTHYTERYLGTPRENSGAYNNSSALTYAENITGSLLIMHGMSDDNVLLAHTNELLSKLQSSGKTFELMLYPDSKHSLQETSVMVHRFNLILDFFNRTL